MLMSVLHFSCTEGQFNYFAVSDLRRAAFFPDFVFDHVLLSAGKRDLHFTECSEEFVRAETTQAAAAGGGQRTGRLHWYGAVSTCVRPCVSRLFSFWCFFHFLILLKLICFRNQIKQPENELTRYYCSSLNIFQRLQNPPWFYRIF